MKKVYDFLKKYVLLLALPLLLAGCNPAPGGEAIDSCTSCKLFSAVFMAINRLSQSAMDNMRKDALMLLGIGYAFWLVIVVARGLLARQKADAEFYRMHFIAFGKVALVALILSASPYLYYVCRTFINPVLDIFFDFSKFLTERGAVMSGLTTQGAADAFQSYVDEDAGNIGILDNILARNVEVMLYYIQQFLSLLIRWGARFQAEAKMNMTLGVMGVIMLVFGYGMSMAYLFMLIEPILRLGVLLVMLPIWLAGLCFSATKKMAMTAMKAVFVAAGQVFLTAVYCSVFFIFVLGMAAMFDIPKNDFGNLAYHFKMMTLNIDVFVFICIFFMVYYFMRGMNKSMGFIMKEDFSNGMGSSFMIGIATIVKWAVILLITIATMGGSASKHAADAAKKAAEAAKKGADATKKGADATKKGADAAKGKGGKGDKAGGEGKGDDKGGDKGSDKSESGDKGSSDGDKGGDSKENKQTGGEEQDLEASPDENSKGGEKGGDSGDNGGGDEGGDSGGDSGDNGGDFGDSGDNGGGDEGGDIGGDSGDNGGDDDDNSNDKGGDKGGDNNSGDNNSDDNNKDDENNKNDGNKGNKEKTDGKKGKEEESGVGLFGAAGLEFVSDVSTPENSEMQTGAGNNYDGSERGDDE